MLTLMTYNEIMEDIEVITHNLVTNGTDINVEVVLLGFDNYQQLTKGAEENALGYSHYSNTRTGYRSFEVITAFGTFRVMVDHNNPLRPPTIDGMTREELDADMAIEKYIFGVDN